MYLAEEMDVNSFCADVFEIALRVVLEVVGHRHPEGLLSALAKVLKDKAGNCSALTNTGTVAWITK